MPFSLEAHESAVVHFLEDARAVAAAVGRSSRGRLADAAPHLQAAAASGVPVDTARELEAAAKALLGDDFVLVPEFVIASSQAGELANALAASRSGALFEHLVHPAEQAHPPIDFPVDTWLHGAARVRERLQAWEQVMILAGVFGRPEPPLDALQLPHVPATGGSGSMFPQDRTLEADRLLYTAHFAAPFDPAQRLCGLLLDEWTETIPASEVDTGIALHYDRPNAEAPQTMLLVTPTEFRGAWQWDDLVDALNETLDPCQAACRRAHAPRPTAVRAVPAGDHHGDPGAPADHRGQPGAEQPGRRSRESDVADRFITANLRAVIAERATPAVTLWNRLEGRPRAETFERALRAEIRDALWMLTRQWQIGEFRGDDAGSPIVAKVRVRDGTAAEVRSR